MSLTRIQIGIVIDSLPDVIITMLKENPGTLVLAGGFIRAVLEDELRSDIDLFTDYDRAVALVDKLSPGKGTIETENAITVKRFNPPVQFIHNWKFNDPEDVIGLFDFTIAKAAIWWNGEAFVSNCDKNFNNDREEKLLRYEPLEGHNDSLPRVLKFYALGYKIDARSLARVVADSLAIEGFAEMGAYEIETYAAQLSTSYAIAPKHRMV